MKNRNNRSIISIFIVIIMMFSMLTEIGMAVMLDDGSIEEVLVEDESINIPSFEEKEAEEIETVESIDTKKDIDKWIGKKIEEISNDYLNGEVYYGKVYWVIAELGKIEKPISEESIDYIIEEVFKLDNNANEMLKQILALRGAGYDPENIYGRNLIDELINHEETRSFYYEACGLWAINSDNYSIDEENSKKVDKMVEDLLKYQKEDGYFENFMKIDDTGFALLALAPYYNNTVKYDSKFKEDGPYRKKLTDSVEKALDAIEKDQMEDGDISEDNGNSLIMTIMGISSIDSDLIKNGFIKDGKTFLHALKNKYDITNGFKRKIEDEVLDAMATEQGLRALINYEFETNVFDYSGSEKKTISGHEEFIKETIEKEINSKLSKIKPEDYTPDSVKKVKDKLEEIKKILNDDELDFNKVYELYNDLIEAIDSLVEQPSRPPTDGGGGGGGSTEKPEENFKKSVTLSVDKKTINKGYTLRPTKVQLKTRDTVWDVLKRELDSRSIGYEFQGENEFGSVYIESIDGDGEFDHGEYSGWMYNVNGEYPNYGADKYRLKDGDKIQWRYTTNLGKDLGEDLSEWENDKGSGGGGGGGGKDEDSKNTSTEDKEKKDEEKSDNKLDSNKKDDESIDNNEIDFEDIKNHWAKEPINAVVSKGYFKGTSENTFSPNRSMTRGEFVTVLGRRLNVDVSEYNNKIFKDVEVNMYYSSYASWAEENNIVKGYSDGTFKPTKEITREEMAVILDRYLKVSEEEKSFVAEMEFKDKDFISFWAKTSVDRMAKMGLINGKGNNRFAPKDNLTRAEIAQIIYNLEK